MSKDMKDFLKVESEKIQKMVNIKKDFLDKKIDLETANALININFDTITPEEFAFSEQKIKDMGYSDDIIHHKMTEVFNLFKNKIVQNISELPDGHPIKTYINENKEIKKLIEEMKLEILKNNESKFIKNVWLELYDKMYQFNIHLSRKQNQLFSILESKGFDRPSRIMWTFDNAVKDSISKARKLLNEDDISEFIKHQEIVWDLVLDIIDKEESILYPTSLKMISEEEFRNMRYGDDEIGYCLIEKPKEFYPIKKDESDIKNNNFMEELSNLLSKYNMENKAEQVFDVSQGKLTLEQINLIYKHLPIDLSYVDENEIVKFYSDTKHRVFPRSAGVIGRDVKNCHPRESVGTVEAIIEAFRAGEQDVAEFWIEINGKFIYIYYVAVRDENGKFRGVLEMMQDATRIRSLKGNRRLLMWEDENEKKDKWDNDDYLSEEDFNITKDSVIGDIIDKYPFIREYMPTLSDNYKKLLDDEQYKIMSKIATLEMVAIRGNFEVEYIIEKIVEKIREHLS